MHILIAADSFKGSNSSIEVGRAIRRGFARVLPAASFEVVPVADGGEGTVAAVLHAAAGSWEELAVSGPLGECVQASWGRLPGKAVLEMAAASGLPLLLPEQRDPLRANTYGTGQLLRAALDSGAKQILLGVGGSASNDGGVGLAQALGARFFDQHGHELPGGGGSLAALTRIDISGLDPRLPETEILIACDVRNPLCGAQGAAAIYGPQKGANPEMIKILDANMEHLATIVKRDLGTDYRTTPGAGAGGGLGFGLMSFCGGKLLSGLETLLQLIGFDKMVARADLIITGEGRLDGQSLYGKVPLGVAKWAAGKPVIAIVGELGPRAEAVFAHGIASLYPTVARVMTLKQALNESRIALEDAAERVARTLLVGYKLPLAGAIAPALKKEK